MARARWRRWLFVLSAAWRCPSANSGSTFSDLASALLHPQRPISFGGPSYRPGQYLEVFYSSAMQPVLKLSVGGQDLTLVFDASSANTVVFVREYDGCIPDSSGSGGRNTSSRTSTNSSSSSSSSSSDTAAHSCYSWIQAQHAHGLRICAENNENDECTMGSQGKHYSCDRHLENLTVAQPHFDELVIHGIQYFQKYVEAIDKTRITLWRHGPDKPEQVLGWNDTPVRLLVRPLLPGNEGERLHPSLPLFEGVHGLLGSSGPSLSCRSTTFWGKLLAQLNVTKVALDFAMPPQVSPPVLPPADEGVPMTPVTVVEEEGLPLLPKERPNALPDLGARPAKRRALATATGVKAAETERSRIIFDEVQPGTLWSQPKQTGGAVNNGMPEFLMFLPEVCGVDLLYNISSNWVAIIDTSGPCMSLPPFLFDRIRAHIPVQCPFQPGEPSKGQLCWPDRSQMGGSLLPSFSFQLEDAQEPLPPRLDLPLERLVFWSASGQELLCMVRADSAMVPADAADMMLAHIALGSLAVASLYTVINLENRTLGFKAKGNATLESSEAACAVREQCTSHMQVYYPPLNLCEDPRCEEYMFMTLGEDHTCRWSSAVPAMFGFILISLAFLDLVSHRLYKQAIEKASDYIQ